MASANNPLSFSVATVGHVIGAPGPKLGNARVNKTGGVAFDGLFARMPKQEDFAVYPLDTRDQEGRVTIQSKTRIGWITKGGDVYLSPSISSGAHRPHLALSVLVDKINTEEMFHLKACVLSVFDMKAEAKARVKSIVRAAAHA